MFSLQQSVLIFATLGVFVSSALALKCFNCNSIYDPKCLDPFDNSTIPMDNCSLKDVPRHLEKLIAGNAKSTACMKATNEDVNGIQHIIRSCFFGDIESKTIGCKPDPSHKFVKQIACEVCTGNGCNNSSRPV